MRTGVVDIDIVADVDARQVAVDRKLVVVLTQAAGHIIGAVMQRVLLAENGDMVVSAVHRRAHEVGRAGVQTGILLVGVLVVDALGNECAVGAEDEAAHLGVDGNIAHARRNEDLVERAVNALADCHDVVRLLPRLVGDAYAARQVDERDMHAGLLLNLNGQLEQDAGERRIILVCDRVGREERMNAEVLYTLLLHVLERLDELLAGHAVLGLLRGVHDLVFENEVAARIETAGHGFLPLAYLVVVVEVGDVIKVYDGVEVACELEILVGRHVRGEHDVVTGDAAGAAELKLGIARAVAAEALLVEDLHQTRGRGRLDREVFLVARVPRKRRLYLACVLADRLFIIDMKRRRVGLADFLRLFEGQKRFLFHVYRLAFFGNLRQHRTIKAAALCGNFVP